MRRAIIKKFSKAKVVFIVAGTNETLAQFISNDITRTSSEKSSQKKIYEPFYKVLFIDHLVPKTYFEKLIENLYNNIDQRDPYKSLFYFGRPLWGSLIEAFKLLNQREAKVFELAQEKLFNKEWSEIKDESKIFAAIAVLSSRTTLSVDYKVHENSKISRSAYEHIVLYLSKYVVLRF